MRESCIMSLSAPDRIGLVAAVAGFLAERGCNITEAQQFNDPASQMFFMRLAFDSSADLDSLRREFAPLAEELNLTWKLRPSDYMPKIIIMASRFDHCLGDLLYRRRIGELKMDVVGIINNHPKSVLKTPLVDGFPFHHIPVSKETKAEQEAKVKDIIEDTGAELVVLARYMQILSDDFAQFLSGRCINIHHSFLPGFKGAKPYHQAYDRGVKMIGATSHYVTADLDEGPIIAQDVVAISHLDTADDLVVKGRDVERRVLARALRAHIEDRVFLNNGRTVVFEN